MTLALLMIAMTLPSSACASDPPAVRLPPVTGTFDYQLGGTYDVTGPAVLVRDATARPLPGAYNVCYVNGFQTQPGTGADWLPRHPAAVLRDAGGSPVADEDWPDEYVLDPSSPEQRTAILDVMGPVLAGCGRDGFDAVEIDNFDTFTRFDGISRDGARELARSYASLAHADGMAIGQKNAAEFTSLAHDVGFDFAVAEECAAFDECASYADVYGPHVLQIEYTDNAPQPFTAVCESDARAPLTILRDRELVARGTAGYAYEQCG